MRRKKCTICHSPRNYLKFVVLFSIRVYFEANKMESHRVPKISKRRSMLTLNKKGSRYYTRAKLVLQKISHTSSSPADLTDLSTHEIPSGNFVSQPSSVGESASSVHKHFPSPATTKYHQTLKTSNCSKRKCTETVSTETITYCDKNIQTNFEDMLSF